MRSMIHVGFKKASASGIALAAAVALTLSGCGGGDSTAAAGAGTVTGKFVDAPVDGLGYKCGTSTALSGTTGDKGVVAEFTCKTGETVTFFVGGIKLGSVAAAQAVVTPLDLVSATATPSDPKVTNIVRFLMSISSTDPTVPGGKITIDPKVVTDATNLAIDFTQTAPTNLDSVIATIKPPTAAVTAFTGSQATAHMEKSYFGLFAGDYSGTFSGTYGGTWKITIASTGVVTGTATDGTTPVTVSGSMLTTMGANKTYTFTGTGGVDAWTGTLDVTTKKFSGTWGTTGNGGTFTGTGTVAVATTAVTCSAKGGTDIPAGQAFDGQCKMPQTTQAACSAAGYNFEPLVAGGLCYTKP